jgi:hypothetical protein
VGTDELIDRNRRLLQLAEATRGSTRQVVKMSGGVGFLLDDTAWRWVDLQRARAGLLADMIYLRHSLAEKRDGAGRGD